MLTHIKKYLFLLIFIFVQPNVSRAESEAQVPLSYLTTMVAAHKKSNYELLYILQKGEKVESFRLRHSFVNGKEYAQLLNLDHSREEIILRDEVVSYLGLNFRPFSLNSRHILDNLPNVLYSDYKALGDYMFLDSGKDRVSDRTARVIRLIPNDDSRYRYILWIDEETHLLLKSHLLDNENVILEEFRVIQLYQTKELEMIATVIESLMLPALVSTKKENREHLYSLKMDWLPTGFKLIENQTISGKHYAIEVQHIDSYLYSDGLSTLNIYVMPSQGVNFNEYAWQQGKLTILNQTVDDKDIVIIGEIPLESAKEILKNIHFLKEPEQ